MATHRGIVQAAVAIGFLAALVALLRWQALTRSAAQRDASLWGIRGHMLLVAASGVLVVVLVLWGMRNRLGVGLVAVVLTVVVATSPPAVINLPGLMRLWTGLWLHSNVAIITMVWGAATATCVASIVTGRRATR